jgi:hypothetical protein
MELSIPHRVVYDFDGQASVAEVAKSIIAQDRLVRESLAVLEQVFPDLAFEKPTVSVREVSQASPLRTVLLTTVVAVYGPALGEDVPDILNTLFGVDVPDGYDSIVSVLVLLIGIYGVDLLWKKLSKKVGEYRALRDERDRLLKEAANQASVTEEHLEEAIERVISKRKRSVMKAGADFYEPARRHKARSVSVDGAEVRQEAIEAMPSDIDLAQYEPPTEVEELEGVVVHFRAHDLDRNKAWAATIEEVYPNRRPLHLAPDVRPEQLFERSEVIADVLVTSSLDADGEYVPTLYYLQRVHDDQPSTERVDSELR